VMVTAASYRGAKGSFLFVLSNACTWQFGGYKQSVHATEKVGTLTVEEQQLFLGVTSPRKISPNVPGKRSRRFIVLKGTRKLSMRPRAGNRRVPFGPPRSGTVDVV
jgi:hypothetical protein